jgi:hypothetical protein
MTTLFREPLLAFVAAGALVYGAYAMLEPDDRPVVTLTPGLGMALAEEFEALTGRAPTEAERAQLEREYITEELLFREALANGMHLTNGDVRESLVEAMRYRITGIVPDPSDEELVNFYADNLERYRAEPTITFEHVFFEVAPDADLRERLEADDVPEGDPFPHGRRFPGYGESMLRGLFGQAFLEALKAQPEQAWSGAITSDYGTHYVRVLGRTAAERLPFGQVRYQVETDFRQSVIAGAVDGAVAELEDDYEIRRQP